MLQETQRLPAERTQEGLQQWPTPLLPGTGTPNGTSGEILQPESGLWSGLRPLSAAERLPPTTAGL